MQNFAIGKLNVSIDWLLWISIIAAVATAIGAYYAWKSYRDGIEKPAAKGS